MRRRNIRIVEFSPVFEHSMSEAIDGKFSWVVLSCTASLGTIIQLLPTMKINDVAVWQHSVVRRQKVYKLAYCLRKSKQ